MEIPCYRCNTPVEEGVSFCPNCGAPQIRVSAASVESPAEAAAQFPIPPDQPVRSEDLPHGVVNWSKALPAAAMSGLLIGFAWIVPVSTFVLWVLVGGALGVFFYQRRAGFPEVTPGMGLKIGALSGVFAFVLFALMTSIQLIAMRNTGMLRNLMQQVVQQAATKNTDPRAQEMIQKLMSPEGLATLVTITMIAFFFSFVLFSGLGGAVGAAVFGKRTRR